MTKNYKINDLSDDAQIQSIGSFFRKITASTWGVNLTFSPQQEKPSLSASYASTLVRKRYLNPTLGHSLAGYSRTVSIEKTQNWQVTRIGECPALQRKNTLKAEASQFCFTFQGELGTTFYIPQFELARVLFLQNGYLSRTALEPDCLNIEFDIIADPLTGSKSIINIPLSSGYPVSSLNDEQCRQKLSWILLDPDARASYESIGQSQKLHGIDKKDYRFWDFRFTPPPLPLCEFDFKGIFDKETNCMFVYEIAAMRNISCKVPSLVRFDHPKFRENLKADGKQGTASTPKPALDYILDDDAETNSDNEHMFLHAPNVIFEFSKTFFTEKITDKKHFGASGRKDDEAGINDSKGTQNVGINESTRTGDVPQAELNAVMDITEDLHLYESKFECFQQMVDLLVSEYGYTINSKQVHELPNVVNCSKHLLSDENPRYISVISITNVNGVCFHILEVDTSDTVKPLSTQLLMLISKVEWESQILELEKALVKRSLRWDSNLLTRLCGRERYQGVPHPSTESTDKNLLSKDSIAHWARRFNTWMLSMM